MLFDTLKEQERVWQSNVSGDTSCGKFAFRGDLAVTIGDMHESSNTRNQPKCVFENACIIIENDKFVFTAGSLLSVSDIADFFETFGEYIADGSKIILYVVNAKNNMTIEYNGHTVYIRPYDESTVWQLLMEDLYVEKSDLKGESAEDKVMIMYKEAASFNPKDAVISFEDACANITDAKRAIHGAV